MDKYAYFNLCLVEQDSDLSVSTPSSCRNCLEERGKITIIQFLGKITPQEAKKLAKDGCKPVNAQCKCDKYVKFE